MPKYQYTALDHKGDQKTGSLEANSEAEAMEAIRAHGLYPTQIVEAGKGKIQQTPAAKKKAKGAKKQKGKLGGKIKAKALMIFTRQLATLIDAGLPPAPESERAGQTGGKPQPARNYRSSGRFRSGRLHLLGSLAQHPRIFDRLFVNMVKAGELGGVLEVVLNRLAEYQEKAQKLKSKVISAMVYPSIVLFIAVGIVIFLMLVIVPKFKAMFAEQNQELPGISEFVFGISDWFMAAPFFVPNAVILAAVVAILYAVFTAMSKTPNGRRKIDSALLTMPVIGNVQSKSAIARFARTFGTLVTSGVPILQALTITKDTAGNMIVGDAIGLIHDSVKEGESVVTPMSSSKLFPPMVISMVDVGEETGQLPDMLLKIADVYDDEVDNAVGAMTSMLEPIMIVFLAVVVGGIVFAMFLPLLQVIEKMG